VEGGKTERLIRLANNWATSITLHAIWVIVVVMNVVTLTLGSIEMINMAPETLALG
jgi:hypothetical protein